MRRAVLSVLGFCACVTLFAQEIRDIDIRVELQRDGSATVTQVWDVTVVSGTEWYIPIASSSGMTVSDLSVSENGTAFRSLGDSWNVDADREQKRNRCGINHPGGGKVELCWGLGDYGAHRWTASYRITGLVQSLHDYDAFNHMFVNPGLEAPPQHVKLTVVNGTGGPAWTSSNTRVWGFGFYGDINVVDGAVVAESSEPFSYNSSVIAMVRFDKGLLDPAVSRDIDFDEMRSAALDGSGYGEKDPVGLMLMGLFALVLFLVLGGAVWMLIATLTGHKWSKSLFGKTKITEWYRDVPVEGNLFAAYFVLEKGKRFAGGNNASSQNLIGALFLRWILDGKVSVQAESGSTKRVNLSFLEEASFQDDVEAALYEMARTASGENLLLESGEFEKWSEKNFRKVTAWPARALARGKRWFHDKGYFLRGTKTSEEGAREACHVIEFQNFLKDFTLSEERGASEVGLWKDYLVFSQLYGIADKVAAQFKKLYPAQFQEVTETVGVDPNRLLNTIRYTRSMSTAAMGRAVARYQAGSIKGTGGHTSFGGGGGFSGGGFGGGSR